MLIVTGQRALGRGNDGEPSGLSAAQGQYFPASVRDAHHSADPHLAAAAKRPRLPVRYGLALQRSGQGDHGRLGPLVPPVDGCRQHCPHPEGAQLAGHLVPAPDGLLVEHGCRATHCPDDQHRARHGPWRHGPIGVLVTVHAREGRLVESRLEAQHPPHGRYEGDLTKPGPRHICQRSRSPSPRVATPKFHWLGGLEVIDLCDGQFLRIDPRTPGQRGRGRLVVGCGHRVLGFRSHGTRRFPASGWRSGSSPGGTV